VVRGCTVGALARTSQLTARQVTPPRTACAGVLLLRVCARRQLRELLQQWGVAAPAAVDDDNAAAAELLCSKLWAPCPAAASADSHAAACAAACQTALAAAPAAGLAAVMLRCNAALVAAAGHALADVV
jgi:hypothetical protein